MNGVAVLAALSGAMAVIAGAFGAHGASGEAQSWLRTGAEYQMVHAVAALVALGWPGGRGPAMLFVAGGLVFGATLYAMALGAPRILGAVTPIGGGLIIAGWLWSALLLWRR